MLYNIVVTCNNVETYLHLRDVITTKVNMLYNNVTYVTSQKYPRNITSVVTGLKRASSTIQRPYLAVVGGASLPSLLLAARILSHVGTTMFSLDQGRRRRRAAETEPLGSEPSEAFRGAAANCVASKICCWVPRAWHTREMKLY